MREVLLGVALQGEWQVTLYRHGGRVEDGYESLKRELACRIFPQDPKANAVWDIRCKPIPSKLNTLLHVLAGLQDRDLVGQRQFRPEN